MNNPIYRNKSYICFWIGQSVSNLGSSITMIVLPLIILNMTKSALQVSIVSAIEIIPYAIFGLPAGVLLDKWNRKKVMRVCDFVRFLAFGSITFAGWLNVVHIYHIYLVALISGIGMVFHSISEVSILPSFVEKEQLGKANSYTYGASNLMYMIGPSIGGFLYVQITGYNTLGLDALSYLISFIFISFIKLRPKEGKYIEKRSNTKRKVKELIINGFSYLWKQKAIRVMLLIVTFMNLIDAHHIIFIP